MPQTVENHGSKNATHQRFEFRHHPLAIAVMTLIMIGLLGLTAVRIHKNYSSPANSFDWQNRGFSDFHNGTYFPTKAFVHGKSPYSKAVAEEYNMCRPTPPYSPVVFMLHVPFALLSLEASRVAFFFYNFALIGCLAYFGLKMSFQSFRWFDFLALTNLLLVSRPGHITMFTGYFTAEIVIGCILALHYAKTKPAISGLGLVLASIKPNFVIPLLLLMTFRRNFRALILGIAFCTIGGALGIGWLCVHKDLSRVVADVRQGQHELHIDPTEMPINTWTRVDLLGMYAKVVDWVPDDKIYLGLMVILVSIVGIFLWRLAGKEQNEGATGLSATIVCLTLLLSLYHHSYDCLLMAVPAIGLLFFSHTTMSELPAGYRSFVALFIAVPAINYASTKSAMEIMSLEPLGFWWQAVTLINGLCLLSALLILIYQANRLNACPPRPDPEKS